MLSIRQKADESIFDLIRASHAKWITFNDNQMNWIVGKLWFSPVLSGGNIAHCFAYLTFFIFLHLVHTLFCARAHEFLFFFSYKTTCLCWKRFECNKICNNLKKFWAPYCSLATLNTLQYTTARDSPLSHQDKFHWRVVFRFPWANVVSPYLPEVHHIRCRFYYPSSSLWCFLRKNICWSPASLVLSSRGTRKTLW